MPLLANGHLQAMSPVRFFGAFEANRAIATRDGLVVAPAASARPAAIPVGYRLDRAIIAPVRDGGLGTTARVVADRGFTAYALTGGQISLVTIVIGSQIQGDVFNNQGLGNALALGMVVIMALSVALYSALQQRTARWLR